MKQEGYGRGYEYAHDREEGTSGMSCLPESLLGQQFYKPTDRGMEKRLGEWLAEIRRVQAGLRRSEKSGSEKNIPPASAQE